MKNGCKYVKTDGENRRVL